MARVTVLIPNRNEPMLTRTVSDLMVTLGDLAVYQIEDDLHGTGVGATLRRGLKHVNTEWVIFAMADGSEDPSCLRNMALGAIRIQPDAVWGTRWSSAGSQVVGYPRLKRIANRLGNKLIAAHFWSRYDDWTDLAKAYRTEWLREISWDDDFRCEVQIPLRYLVQCLARNGEWNIPVVPMRWVERSAGTSSYRARHAIGCLRAFWQEWRSFNA